MTTNVQYVVNKHEAEIVLSSVIKFSTQATGAAVEAASYLAKVFGGDDVRDISTS